MIIMRNFKNSNHIRSIILLVAMMVWSIASARADAIETFRESKAINAPKAAVLIMDLETGKEVAEHNADTGLIPASIMKCVTVAGLIETLGQDWKYRTEVYRTGSVKKGVLEGNLIVKGSGDPSLNSRHIEGNRDICSEIAASLAREGVDSIRGNVIIDESVWHGPAVPPSWASGDLSQSYGTGSHGLNFEDNASGKRSIANPAEVFRMRLRTALERAGINLMGERLDNGREHPLLTHESVPLDEIMRSCMMRSDNQYAEAMLRTIAVAKGKEGSTENGASLNTAIWKRHKAPMDNVKIVDGSGLSRSNRVTARFMASVLSEMSQDPYYASFFPLAGQEGTLRNFLAGTPLEGYIAMKTGSMNGIQCYAGYKLDDDYAPTHVVVVILNEMANRAAARQAVATLLSEVFNQEQSETTGGE